MRTVTYRLADLQRASISIGFVGENEYTRVQFDALKVFEEYPSAIPTLSVVNPAGTAYPVVVTHDGDYVIWDVQDSDLVVQGRGEAQLTFTSDGVVVKSYVFRTVIDRSIVANGETPDPVQNWIDEANSVLAEVEEAIPAGGTTGQVLAKKSNADRDLEWVNQTGGGGGGTSDYEELNNKPQIAGVTLSGDVSLHDIGAAAESDIPDVSGFYTKPGTGIPSSDLDSAVQTSLGKADTAYQKPGNGIPASDMENGAIPDPTSIIDDTAGDGDTDKVLSADKVTEITTGLSEAIEKLPEEKDSTATEPDLDVSDEDGNVLVRMQNGHIRTAFFNSAKYGAKVVTLKPSGGDFSTLKAALDSITDADPETNPYEIHVYPGEYNTLDGFTQEEIEAADIGGGYTDDSMVGCKLTNGISLIGIGDRSKIILTASLENTYSAAVRGNISTLNLQGTCRIENLTIKAQRIRYCIHDDFGASGHYERIVRNCAFIGLGTSMSYYPPVTYGAGIANPGITALFEDCDFGYSWGMHTRQLMTGDSLLILRNCRGLVARVGDQAYQNDTAMHSFIFDNCNFTAISIARPNTTVPHCFVQGTNNPKTMLFSPAEDIPVFSNILKAGSTSLPVGTVVNVTNGEITGGDTGIKAVKATSIDSALGVIVDKDDLYDYIQTDGFIQGDRLGIQNLAVGDYVTVDADMVLTSGGTASNAFGVVKYTDSNDRSQIWMMGR